MRFRLDSVPATFNEAFAETLAGLEPHEQEQLCALNSGELHLLGPSLGALVRGAWSLWDDGTPLRLDCARRGLSTHPDDLAIAILSEAWAELCGA